jgi:hypothetical protein
MILSILEIVQMNKIIQNIWKIICDFFFQKKNAVICPPTPLSEIEEFEKRIKTQFLKTFVLENNENNENQKWSSNIESIFYNRESYKEIVKDIGNVLESRWKTNILLFNTPRGNIMMYYNVYKEGFSYYCDQSSVPYTVLNAAAMKYVMRFCCRDFFVDEAVLSSKETVDDGYITPFLGIIRNEWKEENEKQKKTHENMIQDNDTFQMSDVFVTKKKQEEQPSQKGAEAVESVEAVKAVKAVKETQEKVTNKFIYMGKINNAILLKKVALPIKSNMKTQYDDFFNDSTERNRMSYHDFKKKKMNG